eukprot:CAMPEP_0116550858 /NCGR_PEP_ID=MMETSP0397-20121206/5651_1 /TAXON_ID=216820 /ORGANISM="Cyclophora tenuis, Strain ECT3854" /LENGTH=183 /DNA_ID=CAMNT_0004075717 /DNA_START=10 /DNA_END=561 /DNA_ORIENTATION=-
MKRGLLLLLTARSGRGGLGVISQVPFFFVIPSRSQQHRNCVRMSTTAGRCEPCSSLNESAVLPVESIKDELNGMPLWRLVENGDDSPLKISRSFVAKNFQAALDCINAMGAIAEREGHHPDFHLTEYRSVEIVLFTHKLRGITTNDLVLARMFDSEVQVSYSPKWLRDHPEAASNTIYQEGTK